MSWGMKVAAIAVSAVCTFAMRALPFAVFSGDRRAPHWLERLGQSLPGAIMAVLVAYCLQDLRTDLFGVGMQKLIAAAVVAVSYKWKHNLLLSMVVGTAAYMLFLRLW